METGKNGVLEEKRHGPDGECDDSVTLASFLDHGWGDSLSTPSLCHNLFDG